jgi:hypothetical protein
MTEGKRTDGKPEGQNGAGTPASRSCPWCSAAAPAEATHCPACGAALAERDSLGDMVIPGVTDVDPALAAASGDGALTRLKRVNSRNALLNNVVPTLLIDDPVLMGAGAAAGLTAIGLDAVTMGGPADASNLGQASDAALAKAAEMDSGVAADGAEPAAADGAEPAAADGAEPAAAESPPPEPPDPWSDLAPASMAEQIAGTEFDPWTPADGPWASRSDPWASQPDLWADPKRDPWATDGGPWSGDPRPNEEEGKAG